MIFYGLLGIGLFLWFTYRALRMAKNGDDIYVGFLFFMAAVMLLGVVLKEVTFFAFTASSLLAYMLLPLYLVLFIYALHRMNFVFKERDRLNAIRKKRILQYRQKKEENREE